MSWLIHRGVTDEGYSDSRQLSGYSRSAIRVLYPHFLPLGEGTKGGVIERSLYSVSHRIFNPSGVVAMHENSALTSIHSPAFSELHNTFHRLKRPYGLMEITRFNQTYERVYQMLRREEKRHAEALVDTLIDGLETPRLADKIFGVV